MSRPPSGRLSTRPSACSKTTAATSADTCSSPARRWSVAHRPRRPRRRGHSDQLALTGTPARVDNPRTGAATTWMTVEDPIQGRNRVLPATYGLVASMSARQSWEPAAATKHGPMITDPRTRTRLLKVLGVHPADFTAAQRDSQDNIWLTTLRKYSGRGGIYPTQLRLWGQFRASRLTASPAPTTST